MSLTILDTLFARLSVRSASLSAQPCQLLKMSNMRQFASTSVSNANILGNLKPAPGSRTKVSTSLVRFCQTADRFVASKTEKASCSWFVVWTWWNIRQRSERPKLSIWWRCPYRLRRWTDAVNAHNAKNRVHQLVSCMRKICSGS